MFSASIALPGRSYNVSLPTATQVSRPETRCYLGYRYPCTRRGRQGASCAFLLLALDDQARRHTNSHGQTHGRGRGGSCALVEAAGCATCAARTCSRCSESLTQFVNPSAPKSYTPSHRRIGLERAVVTPLNLSHQSHCPGRATGWRATNARCCTSGEEVCSQRYFSHQSHRCLGRATGWRATNVRCGTIKVQRAQPIVTICRRIEQPGLTDLTASLTQRFDGEAMGVRHHDRHAPCSSVTTGRGQIILTRSATRK